MDSYQLQAEREMWEEIARNDRPATSHPQHKPMNARFPGKCDHCGARIRRGDPISYSSLAPRGHKVLCSSCR